MFSSDMQSARDRADAPVLARMFEDSFDDIWKFARRRVDSAADADDLASEVYAIAWRRRDAWPRAEERRLWLFGIARNVVRNHHRGRRRQDRTVARLASVVELPGRQVEEPPIERDHRLANALALLAEDDREILLLRAWDQLGVQEIAVLLGCSANAASLRLSKARKRLRNALDQTDPSATGHVVVEPTRTGERNAGR